MLGAYFGSTTITQGAGGLGQDGPLQAYADGVVGGNAESADMPGPLFSYHDGSLGLGQDGPLLAYADGVVGGDTTDADSPGLLFAYKDGSLGRALGSDDDDATPVCAFHDGSLGERYDGMNTFGPLLAYHDGSLGATQVALDLGDQSAMTEVKAMMSLLAPEQTLTADGQKVYTADWYTSGIWDPQASLLWQYIVSKTAALSGKDVSVTANDQTFPNATGVGFMVATIGAPTASAYGPEYLKKTFPILSAWFAAGGGPVLAPYLSLADKTREQRAASSGTKMSTMAMYGLGAVALLGLALVLRRR